MRLATFASILCGCALAHAAAARAPAPVRVAVDVLVDGGSAPGPVELAVEHARRARASGDGSHYARALYALERAAALDPPSPRLRVIEAWVRLGRHEFAKAEALARTQLAEHPDDPDAWSLLGDALIERGRYAAAERAYQRAMELRPGPGAYLRAASWREALGDRPGALRLFELARVATDRRDSEQRAWLAVQMARLEAGLGRPRAARARLEAALVLFPDYHYALAALAELDLETRRFDTALRYAERALAVAPHPERHLLRADALRGLGREAEARTAERDFERLALAARERPDNENALLVDFYLDRRPDAGRALEIARAEAERRPDMPALERLARALDRNHRHAEARAVRDRAYGWRASYTAADAAW